MERLTLGRAAPDRGVAQREKLMTIVELAEILGVPVATIYGWRHRGEGPPGYRVGRHIRFRWSQVEEWLDSRADDPPRAVGL